MKIFYKGKLISSYGKGKKMEGRAKKKENIFVLGKSKLGQAKLGQDKSN